jgi:hypothetical protein
MTEKPKTETTTPAFPPASQEAGDDKPSTRRDAWAEALARNPRFVLYKPSGKGFILPAKG